MRKYVTISKTLLKLIHNINEIYNAYINEKKHLPDNI